MFSWAAPVTSNKYWVMVFGSSPSLGRFVCVSDVFEIPTPTLPGYDASKIAGRVVAGDFNGDGIKNEFAAFYDLGAGNSRIDIWSGWPTYTRVVATMIPAVYDATQITGRVVTIDDQGVLPSSMDGIDDIAAFYDNGVAGISLDYWVSGPPGTFTLYSTPLGAFTDAASLTDHVVALDLDAASRRNDIAIAYNLPGFASLQFAVFRRLNNVAPTFVPPGLPFFGPAVLWTDGTMTASSIVGKIVAGDFSGTNRDNVAMFYGDTTLNIWAPAGPFTSWATPTFTPVWTRAGYGAENIGQRIVAGNFLPDDGNYPGDEIVAFYDRGPCNTRVHKWQLRSGSGFFFTDRAWEQSLQNGSGILISDFYESEKITGRLVVGNLAPVGSPDTHDDLCGMYDTGGGHMRMQIWRGGANFRLTDNLDYDGYAAILGWWQE
jgi:hypothetical protein